MGDARHREEGMVFRSRNEHFLKACERYIMRLGEELSSQTINRGDNILMVYKKKIPENRGLFHNFRFSLGYDNLQQAGISEDVGSLTVFLYTAGKGASCPYCGHFSH